MKKELVLLKCPDCPYQTKIKGNYLRHVESHRPRSSQFVCPACGCATKGPRSRQMHMATRHPGINQVLEDDDDFNLDLIDAVRQEPALYNSKCAANKSQRGRYAAWARVAEMLDYTDRKPKRRGNGTEGITLSFDLQSCENCCLGSRSKTLDNGIKNLKKDWRGVRDFFISQRRRGKTNSEWPCFEPLHEWLEPHVKELIERTIFIDKNPNTVKSKGLWKVESDGSLLEDKMKKIENDPKPPSVTVDKRESAEPVQIKSEQPAVEDDDMKEKDTSELGLFNEFSALPIHLQIKALDRIRMVLPEMR